MAGHVPQATHLYTIISHMWFMNVYCHLLYKPGLRYLGEMGCTKWFKKWCKFLLFSHIFPLGDIILYTELMKAVWCHKMKGIILILSCNNSSVHRWNTVLEQLKVSNFCTMPGFPRQSNRSLILPHPVQSTWSMRLCKHMFVTLAIDFTWTVCVGAWVCVHTLNFLSNWTKLLLRLSRSYKKCNYESYEDLQVAQKIHEHQKSI
jgi:hypothetical protein